MREDPLRGLLREKRAFQEGCRRAGAGVIESDAFFHAFDRHAAADPKVDPKKSFSAYRVARGIGAPREKPAWARPAHLRRASTDGATENPLAAAGISHAPLPQRDHRSAGVNDSFQQSQQSPGSLGTATVANWKPSASARPRSASAALRSSPGPHPKAASTASATPQTAHAAGRPPPIQASTQRSPSPGPAPGAAFGEVDGHGWALTSYAEHGYTFKEGGAAHAEATAEKPTAVSRSFPARAHPAGGPGAGAGAASEGGLGQAPSWADPALVPASLAATAPAASPGRPARRQHAAADSWDDSYSQTPQERGAPASAARCGFSGGGFAATSPVPHSGGGSGRGPTKRRSSVVRRKRDELAAARAASQREREEARAAARGTMAAGRADLLKRTLLSGLFAVAAAGAFKDRLRERRRGEEAARRIYRAWRCYCMRLNLYLLVHHRSAEARARRSAAAADLIKATLRSSKLHNKFSRGIARLRGAAALLTALCHGWIATRRARQKALALLVRRLEPAAATRVKRAHRRRERQELAPKGPHVPYWLSRGGSDLSHWRERLLHATNRGKAAMAEARRAEEAWAGRRQGPVQGGGQGGGLDHGGAEPYPRGGGGGEDFRFRLGQEEREVLGEAEVAALASAFLAAERRALMEAHKAKAAEVRKALDVARAAATAAVHLGKEERMGGVAMAAYLEASPGCTAAAVARAAEIQMDDAALLAHRAARGLRTASLGHVLVFSGAARRRLEQRVHAAVEEHLSSRLGTGGHGWD